MKFQMVRNVRLATKFAIMIGITSLLVSFLYGSFYLSIRKFNQYSDGIGLLNSLNQHLLEATVEEKVFLKNANQESLDKVLASISQTKQETNSLREYHQIFHAEDIDGLVNQLETYSNSFQELSKVAQDIDTLDKEIVQTTVGIGEQSNTIIGMINEYDAECQIDMETPNQHLMSLGDVAQNVLVVIGEIFSDLKNDLFYKEDLMSFAEKHTTAMTKLKVQKQNAAVIKNMIIEEDIDKEYFAYIDMVAETYDFLSQTIDTMYRLYEQKLMIQKEFDLVREEVNASKVKMLSLGSKKIDMLKKNVIQTNFFVFCVTLFVVFFGCIFLARSVIKPVKSIIDQLEDVSDQVRSSSNQVAAASQQLAEGSSEQAASIEETSSSLEEISSMTRQNAGNADQANVLTKEANAVVVKTNNSMLELTKSMEQISQASHETSKIIKTIDDIAFQTNLLALNAAVEAARAGEAGAGFAVVSEEVRNLAIRAADAAKNTANLIEGTINEVENGSNLVVKTNEAFNEVTTGSTKIGELVFEIAAASNEQAEGIEQVNKAVMEMDKITQQNAANAEESAAASEGMTNQAEQMKVFIEDLVALVGRSKKKSVHSADTDPMVPNTEIHDNVKLIQ